MYYKAFYRTTRSCILVKITQLELIITDMSRDVKRTSNLWTSKFIFEFGILTFDIRVKFVLEQMWALKCLRTKCDVFVLCRRLTPAASPADCRGWALAMLLVSDYPSHPRPIPLVLPSGSQSAQFDSSHASILVDWSGHIHTSQKHCSIHARTLHRGV